MENIDKLFETITEKQYVVIISKSTSVFLEDVSIDVEKIKQYVDNYYRIEEKLNELGYLAFNPYHKFFDLENFNLKKFVQDIKENILICDFVYVLEGHKNESFNSSNIIKINEKMRSRMDSFIKSFL